MEDKNRQKAIELAVASIEKEYGKGSIMRLKDGVLNADIGVGPHGSASASTSRSASAVIPRGRIIEIYGPESSGKTTLTLHAIAQRRRRPAASRPSSTPSTRSIRPTPASSA